MRKSSPSIDAHDAPFGASPAPAEKGVIDGRDGFVVFALPRSRTAWLSHFLTYGDWHCGHDEIRHMRSLDDVKAWFSQDCTGTVETSVAPFWRLLDSVAPGVRVVVVRRPVDDVVNSLMAISGCEFDRATITDLMRRYDRKLDQIEARIPCLSVNYADLTDEATCAAIFEYCLPYKHDSARWRELSGVNIQINMPALIRYCAAYKPQLDKLASIARHKSRTMLALRRPVAPDGMTIQTETFDDWLKDARHLLEEHHFQIGEDPENWRNKNIPLLRTMFEIGAMQITTARANGRMFGYLMTLLTPSLVTEGVMTAVNTAFFADPATPGVGIKLQRAALTSFQERGIGEVFWETNTVGGAGRIGSIYKRLGAEEKGSVFRLRLAEAA